MLADSHGYERAVSLHNFHVPLMSQGFFPFLVVLAALLDGDWLAGQRTLVHFHVVPLHEVAVGGDDVPDGQIAEVTDHDVGDFKRDELTTTVNVHLVHLLALLLHLPQRFPFRVVRRGRDVDDDSDRA